VAEHGFDRASMVRIARAAGYTTGMLAHYFDTKQDIIIAALRLILRRIDERLTQPAAATARPDLLALLTEALLSTSIDAPSAPSGPPSGTGQHRQRLKRINTGCTASTCVCSNAAGAVLVGVVAVVAGKTRTGGCARSSTFINGLTARR